MSKVSIVIPVRNEPYLYPTVRDLLAGGGDVEIIAVLDGPQTEAVNLPQDKRVMLLENSKPLGRRACTNIGAGVATGKWLMKIDAHCMIQDGFDEILQQACADNWIMIPKRMQLDVENWRTKSDPLPVEAMYYLYAWKNPAFPKFTGRPWPERQRARAQYLIDEDMTFQGSMWFMSMAHWKRLGGMSEKGYGTFVSEPEEIGLKTQLGPWGGAVMRNKNLWFAHWSKPTRHWHQLGPGYMGWVTEQEWWDGWRYTADYWWNNRWAERAHDLEWLIQRFWDESGPLPDWPEDWRTRHLQMNTYHAVMQ